MRELSDRLRAWDAAVRRLAEQAEARVANADALVRDYKEAFRHHPAGVALITAATATGPVGLTASSVASVALDPTALVFSVTRATGSAGALLGVEAGRVQAANAKRSPPTKTALVIFIFSAP